MNKVKTLDKLYNFYEKYFNIIVILVIFIVSNVFYWLNHFNIGRGDILVTYFAEEILLPREGVLGTIAAVFIGIYFTVFSILGTLKADSTLAEIGKEKFLKLVTFIKNAFLFAFVYLLFSILYPWLAKISVGYPEHLFNLLLVILFSFMFLTALKVGLALYIVFKRDLKNLHETIEHEKKEKENRNVILQRLGKTLDEQDNINTVKKAIDMNNTIKRKNPPKK